ncbi:TonB-dependent receptor domain-containing protein [Pontibacter toksunensis]|uniref:TonB-dependent receptor domain-containing protein n=1 Tax=Pontibacter toksunensis TaxID=1332631 RepID=A0ABW6C3C5_9BACT
MPDLHFSSHCSTIFFTKHLTVMLILLFGLGVFPASGQGTSPNQPSASPAGSLVRGNARITGAIIDAATKMPVEYATVTVLDAQTGKVVDGGITDAKGEFVVSKLAAGTYDLRTNFLGYTAKTLEDIVLAADNTTKEVGKIMLEPSSRSLEEVVVTGERPLIEEKVDRLVYNAEDDKSTLGGTGADVLRNVPMLTVDGEGNVQLRGSSNVMVLINGRPSSIMARTVADAIRQIPADIIKSVEVLTSPSARYDAEGTAGIINIITKKYTLQGFTGGGIIVPGNVSTIGSANINYRKGNFGINSSFGTNQFYNRGDSHLERVTERTLYIQDGKVKTREGYVSSQVGFDWNITERSSVGGAVRLTPGHDFIDNTRTAIYFVEGQEQRRSFFDSDTRNKGLSYGFNLDYLYTFKKPQQEFSILTLYDNYHSVDNTYQNEYNTDQQLVARQHSQNKYENREANLQTDYIHPVTEHTLLEVGAKTIQRSVTSDGTFSNKAIVSGRDETIASNFAYDQDVYASYLTYGFKVFQKVNLKLGGRYEFTNIAAEFKTEQQTFNTHYTNIIPSLAMSYTFKEKHTFRANFTQRIQRPNMFYLNPFPQILTPNYFRIGNPKLDAELTDMYELNYGTYNNTVSINAGVFGRITDNAITSRTYSSVDGDTTFVTFLNVARNDVYGINLFGSVKPRKGWTINSNLNLYHSYITGLNTANAGWMYNLSASTSIELCKGWVYRFNGSFNSRRVVLQGRVASFYYHNTTLRKDIFNKRGGIGINLANPFMKGTRMRSEVDTGEFVQREDNINYTRGIRLTFEYRFGQLEQTDKPRKAKKSISNDDALRN